MRRRLMLLLWTLALVRTRYRDCTAGTELLPLTDLAVLPLARERHHPW
jgi:hypothetical protein